MKYYDVIIIGGGASGMMAGIVSASQGANTLILEKNEKLGKKMYITGKGRCNVTNASPVATHLNNVISGTDFMRSAYSQFNADDLMNMLEDNGLPLKVERGQRVFPESDKSSDVIFTLEHMLKINNVRLNLNEKVEYINRVDDKYIVHTNKADYTTYSVVVATGGRSYSSTGSDGYGYKIAKSLGHSIVEPKPALVPILLSQNVSELEGLSLKNVSVGIDDKSLQGEMVFTNKGISGPVVLTLSSYFARENVKDKVLYIDFKPALTHTQLMDKLAREFASAEFSKKSVNTYLKSILPIRFVKYFGSRIDFEQKCVSDTSKQERQTLIGLLKRFEFTINRFDDIEFGIITSGGVELKEINPKTMESKLSKGLYFSGEVLNVDALTGGYNLQIAFSTGYVAGMNASQRRNG